MNQATASQARIPFAGGYFNANRGLVDRPPRQQARSRTCSDATCCDSVKKITGNPNVDCPLQRIREFRRRPNPRVVVTVYMLSTGVDFDLAPLLEMRGGKARARRVFGDLGQFVAKLNLAVAV